MMNKIPQGSHTIGELFRLGKTLYYNNSEISSISGSSCIFRYQKFCPYLSRQICVGGEAKLFYMRPKNLYHRRHIVCKHGRESDKPLAPISTRLSIYSHPRIICEFLTPSPRVREGLGWGKNFTTHVGLL